VEPDSGRPKLIHPTKRHDPDQTITRFKRQYQYNLDKNTYVYAGGVTQSPYNYGNSRPQSPQLGVGMGFRFRRQAGEIGGSQTLFDSRKHRVDGSVFERQNIPEGAQP
jgi:hypothetical protein